MDGTPWELSHKDGHEWVVGYSRGTPKAGAPTSPTGMVMQIGESAPMEGDV